MLKDIYIYQLEHAECFVKRFKNMIHNGSPKKLLSLICKVTISNCREDHTKAKMLTRVVHLILKTYNFLHKH